MNIRIFKITFFAGWILLLAHSGVASPRYIVHNWTISTPIGRLRFQEIYAFGDDVLCAAILGNRLPTERYFCLGPLGRTRTSISSSAIRYGSYAACMFMLTMVSWAVGNGLQRMKRENYAVS